ncbi:MAG: hypothetical protein HY900_22510 [Deltaproteobacteria bacterium]|nr:hypothetical protein [Deltaproteobacteria bacterium]
MLQGSTRGFDGRAVQVLRNPEDPSLPRGPLWLADASRDVTALGSAAVLSLVTLATAGFLVV